MTPRDWQKFKPVFNRLIVAFRPPADTVDPAMRQIYFDALSDLSLSAVEAGADELMRSGGAFFPTTAVWHEAARLQSLRREPYSSVAFDPRYALEPETPPTREEAAALLEQLKARVESMPKPLVFPQHRDLARVRNRPPCPECGATTRHLTHADSCPRGVQRAEVAR